MHNFDNNRFDSFFKDPKYQLLKNSLYSYLLRKRAIEKSLNEETPGLILEVGSGISPVAINSERIVYADLSFEAMGLLKRTLKGGDYVVADGADLPFKSNVFSHAICSEVLEHLENDRFMLNEVTRILIRPAGCLILTLPHRKAYFANDDELVAHYRRYEIREIVDRLDLLGLRTVQIKKVMGPVGKATMSLVAWIYGRFPRIGTTTRPNGGDVRKRFENILIAVIRWLNRCYRNFMWLEAQLVPLALAAVVLIKSFTAERDVKLYD